MISSIISRIVILVFGTLYPAYASYKAVKTKNVKEYVKWMMYWIVFALFTCTETFTDIFLSWFPFYYEIKIILVIWLLSPATKGSSILYRKFVHPMLSSREQEIDEYISKAKEQSYRQVLDLGQKGVTVLMQTAIKGGGGIVNQLRKSYSLSDLIDPANDGASDETDDVLVTDPRLVRRRKPGRSPHRSSSASSASVYFSEVDVVVGGIGTDRVSELRSVEDISSGYSSGEYSIHQPLKLQARESISAGPRASSLSRTRSTRVTRSTLPKKSSITSDDSDENEVFDTNIIFLNDKAKKLDKLPENIDSSSSETEFFDIPDHVGLPFLHGKSFDYSSRIDKFDNKPSNTSNNSKTDNGASSGSLQLAKYNRVTDANNPVFGYDNDSKITACQTALSSTSLSFNLTKLSSALSSLYPSFAFPASSHRAGKDLPESGATIEEIKATDDRPAIEDKAKPEDMIKLEDKLGPPVARGGKYNKKHAPLPPLPPKRDDAVVKATLVLQPGIVRSLSSSAESLNKEIFLNYSPKVKRRSRNQSPASKSSSDSNSSSKNSNNSLSKMLRLPKRVAHLNIPGKLKEKRNSWGEFFHGSKKIGNSKVLSRSASNLDTILENDAQKPIQRSDSQISVRSLTNSPVAHRRLKVLRRFVEDDNNI